MKKMKHIFIEVKIKMVESKYGTDAVIDAIQAYEGDEGDHQYFGDGGWYKTSCNDDATVYQKKVELTKKRRRTLWNGIT